MKKITFRPAADLIERARAVASSQDTDLSEAFRAWLRQYWGHEGKADAFDKITNQLKYARAGGRFTRDEMNER